MTLGGRKKNFTKKKQEKKKTRKGKKKLRIVGNKAKTPRPFLGGQKMIVRITR